MGQRQMCEVGHCTTKALLDDPESNTFNLACIDNTISYGESREQLVETMKRVVRRFKDGNVLLNGQDADGGMDVEALAVQRAEWCGVRFDLVSKEVQLTEKHVGKLGLSLSMRESWSRRSVYAHFGLLFWAIGLADHNPGDYFCALGFYASLCRQFSEAEHFGAGEKFLDEPAEISDDCMAAIAQWTREVMRNQPIVVRPHGRANWLVAVDACATGFGYVAVNPETGDVRLHGQRWPRAFYVANLFKMHRSAFTEPHGVIMSMCHLLEYTGVLQRVHVWTDSVTARAVGAKGFNARSADINDCGRRLRQLFPPQFFVFSFAHLAGKLNVGADALSRGAKVDEVDVAGEAARLLQLEAAAEEQRRA